MVCCLIVVEWVSIVYVVQCYVVVGWFVGFVLCYCLCFVFVFLCGWLEVWLDLDDVIVVLDVDVLNVDFKRFDGQDDV